MASYLRPRRGKKATAEAQNIILKRGEVFFETPTTGVGTGIGKIKVGDGTTAYSSLPYFMEQTAVDVSNAAVTFTTSTYTDNTTLLNTIASNAALKTIIGATKKLLSNHNTSLGGLTFAQDAEGNWGYKPSGADSVIPFKSGDLVEENLVSYFPSLYSAKTGTSITATITSNPIDFTDISFLRFKYTNTTRNRPKYSVTIGTTAISLSPSSNTLMIDVRSITGEQTITFTLTDSYTSSFTGSTMINTISAIKIGELQSNNTSPVKLLPGVRIYKHENGNAYAFTTIDCTYLNSLSYTCSTTTTTYIKVTYEDGTSPTLSTTGVLDVSGHSSMEIKTYANSTTYRYFTITDYS